ncbi:CBS domain-containing protein [Saccharibacillus sp. CPCC 101409]|uniref:CBS domain-containing protein n=1 Tax=Saccharibacillus sp. CPCC 101409 TaxID=3058041 RepID=UPI0026713874|nr:CBS domain-containing protein [Saccharibacillus sp. CPCC 101409]MDO3412546.1 CBS domain-containing protein [Saccharibacillus sp. CPCC 101409]
MKVRDFMIKDVHTVNQDATLANVLQLFVAKRINGAPVVDSEGRLVGMVSDGDILRHINPQRQTVYDMFSYVIVSQPEELAEALAYKVHGAAKKIMKKNVQAVSPDQDLEEALGILAKHHFKKLPVVNDKKEVVGVISRGDLLKQIADRIAELKLVNS